MKNFLTSLFVLLFAMSFGQNPQQQSPFEKTYEGGFEQKKNAYKEEGYAKFFPQSIEGMPSGIDGLNLTNTKAYAAHPKLKLGTIVKLTNIENGQTCYATVIDKYNAKTNFIIELSTILCKKLKCDPNRFIKIRVEELGKKNKS